MWRKKKFKLIFFLNSPYESSNRIIQFFQLYDLVQGKSQVGLFTNTISLFPNDTNK